MRKQLYITEAQDRALKRRARELAVSEAELVRRALNRELGEEAVTPAVRDRRDVLRALLENSRRLAQHRRLEHPIRREELYEERTARWSS